jgi:hypothetical protein
MAGPGVDLVVSVRRSLLKNSRDAAFQSAAEESNGTDGRDKRRSD